MGFLFRAAFFSISLHMGACPLPRPFSLIRHLLLLRCRSRGVWIAFLFQGLFSACFVIAGVERVICFFTGTVGSFNVLFGSFSGFTILSGGSLILCSDVVIRHFRPLAGRWHFFCCAGKPVFRYRV